MYNSEMPGKAFVAKYRALAQWVLDHQNLFNASEDDVVDLSDTIDMAIDNWIHAQDPRE